MMTFYKVIVQSVLLYACEAWAVTVEDVHRLEVFQIKCLQKLSMSLFLLRISNVGIRT